MITSYIITQHTHYHIHYTFGSINLNRPKTGLKRFRLQCFGLNLHNPKKRQIIVRTSLSVSWGFRFRAGYLGFRHWGLGIGFRHWGLGVGVQMFVFRRWGLGLNLKSAKLRLDCAQFPLHLLVQRSLPLPLFCALKLCCVSLSFRSAECNVQPAYVHIYTYTHLHTHALTHSLTHSLSLSLSLSLTHTHTHTHTHRNKGQA